MFFLSFSFFIFICVKYLFFYPITFSLCVCFDLKCVSCRQHVYIYIACSRQSATLKILPKYRILSNTQWLPDQTLAFLWSKFLCLSNTDFDHSPPYFATAVVLCSLPSQLSVLLGHMWFCLNVMWTRPGCCLGAPYWGQRKTPEEHGRRNWVEAVAWELANDCSSNGESLVLWKLQNFNFIYCSGHLHKRQPNPTNWKHISTCTYAPDITYTHSCQQHTKLQYRKAYIYLICYQLLWKKAFVA